MNNFKALFLSTILFGSNLFANIGTDFQNVVSEMRNNRKYSPIIYKALITGCAVSSIVPALGGINYLPKTERPF